MERCTGGLVTSPNLDLQSYNNFCHLLVDSRYRLARNGLPQLLPSSENDHASILHIPTSNSSGYFHDPYMNAHLECIVIASGTQKGQPDQEGLTARYTYDAKRSTYRFSSRMGLYPAGTVWLVISWLAPSRSR